MIVCADSRRTPSRSVRASIALSARQTRPGSPLGMVGSVALRMSQLAVMYQSSLDEMTDT